MSFLIIMLSIQSLHAGYAMGTYNRIRLILKARYRWSQEERNLYEGLISSLLIMGITIGRLFGAWYVQKGRKKCLLTSAFVGIVAITI